MRGIYRTCLKNTYIMKRILSLIAVSAAAVCTLMACSKKASTSEAVVSTQDAAPKVLVAYFSATGTTKAAAEKWPKPRAVKSSRSSPQRLILPTTSIGRRRPPAAVGRTTTRCHAPPSRRARSRSTATTSSFSVSPTGGTVHPASSTRSWTPTN